MDTLIHDLLAKRNYTQARKAIEKKLKQKKFENNSSLLVRLSRRSATLVLIMTRSRKPKYNLV
jgi:hypothetical protein